MLIEGLDWRRAIAFKDLPTPNAVWSKLLNPLCFSLDAQIHVRYQQGMQFDLARLPNDPVLLHQVVRDLADVLERRDAELADTKARLAARDIEIEKL